MLRVERLSLFFELESSSHTLSCQIEQVARCSAVQAQSTIDSTVTFAVR